MRPRRMPVGRGEFEVPYDRSENMPGMELPQPGGNMKKMSFEFADAQDAAAQQQQPQVPEGAGVPPAGMQAPISPAGMQGPSQGGQGSLFGGLAGGADQFGAGPDSSMFTDEQLASMVDEDPMEMVGEDLHGALMDPSLPPQDQEELQLRMMEAARRMGGF